MMKIYSAYHKTGVMSYSTFDPNRVQTWIDGQKHDDEYVLIVLNVKGHPYNDKEQEKLDAFKNKKKEKLDKPAEPAKINSSDKI